MVTQLLPLATGQLVGDNRKFDVFWGVLLIIVGGEIITIADPSIRPRGYQLLPLGNLMFNTYFLPFYSLLVEGSL